MYIYVDIMYICTCIRGLFTKKSFHGKTFGENLWGGVAVHFTLGLTVKKEVLKVVSCSVSLMLTLNLETDTVFEELKKVTSTMTPQNVLSKAQFKNVFI